MFLAPPRCSPVHPAVRSDWAGTLFYIGAVLAMLVISYLALTHPDGLPVLTFSAQRL